MADPYKDELDDVLSTPPEDAPVLRYHADLASVRAFAAAAARQAGLLPGRARDFVIAISELAGNTLAHTQGPGVLVAWCTRHELIGQVSDTGHITGPRPDQVRPGDVGHGLWVVRQVCDRVQIRTGPAGTIIQVHMRLSSSPAA